MTVKLYYNIANSIPATTDPIHYRSFTVDYVDDREIVEIKESHDLLNGGVAEDIIGIKRKLKFYLRTSDIKDQIEFLTSFFNAPYKWAVVTDQGYYFNLGTYSSAVAVPVVGDMDDLRISVPGLIENGINLITAHVYPRPAAPTIEQLSQDPTEIGVTFTTTSLKFKLFRAATSGGTLTFVAYTYGSTTLDTGLSPGTSYYYKASRITIGGESELSDQVTMETDP